MRIHAWLIAAAAALVLTACGGGDSPEAAAQPLRAEPLRAASSAAISDANRLMDFAESRYASLFAGNKTAATLGGIMYRYYASSNIYLGVVVDTQAGLQTNGVYVLGGPFSGLTYVGQLSAFITPTSTSTTTTTTTTTSTTKNLTVTVSALGQTQTVVVGAVPVQNTQTDFCGTLQSDATFKSVTAAYGAAVTVNSCSFNGTAGNVNLTVSVQGTTVPVTVVYTFS